MTPPLPQPYGGPGPGPGSPPSRTTAYVVLGGGALALLAFFAMPLISVPILGSVTGAGAAAMSSQVGALGWLWLVPLAALTITGVGAWHSFASGIPEGQRRTTSIVAVSAAILAILVYVIVLAGLQSALSRAGAYRVGLSAGSLVGAGFWIGLLAVIAAGIAAVAGLRSAAR